MTAPDAVSGWFIYRNGVLTLSKGLPPDMRTMIRLPDAPRPAVSVEPILVSSMRRNPRGEVRYMPNAPEKTAMSGTSTRGFLREYDDAIAEAERRGAEAMLAAVEGVAGNVESALSVGIGCYTIEGWYALVERVGRALDEAVAAARAAAEQTGGAS